MACAQCGILDHASEGSGGRPGGNGVLSTTGPTANNRGVNGLAVRSAGEVVRAASCVRGAIPRRSHRRFTFWALKGWVDGQSARATKAARPNEGRHVLGCHRGDFSLPASSWVRRVGRQRRDLGTEGCDLLLERMQVAVRVSMTKPPRRGRRDEGRSGSATHFRETLVLLIASKPMHSTFARSHAEQAGSLPSHFCFRERHRVHDEMARATLYCVGAMSA